MSTEKRGRGAAHEVRRSPAAVNRVAGGGDAAASHAQRSY